MTLDKIYEQLADSWTNHMPFNQLLGFEITSCNKDRAEVHFDWDDKLVGNKLQNILHGGVTASALDLVGGVVAAANIISQLDDHSMENLIKNLGKLGTIDLRTDFLRPGRGEKFIATSRIIRSGNKVAVARMELHNQDGVHIAFGTGTYMVG